MLQNEHKLQILLQESLSGQIIHLLDIAITQFDPTNAQFDYWKNFPNQNWDQTSLTSEK